MGTSTQRPVLSWILQIIAAVILFQTLYYKFSGAPESMYIFDKLGLEPWGRIGSGIAELIIALLLLIPSTVVIGALLAMGLMAGAILSHLAILGVAIMNDGGLLFALAVVVFVCSSIIVWLRRSQIPVLGTHLRSSG